MNNSFRPRGFGRFSLFPPIIKNLLIINAAVFFFQLVAGNFLIGGKPGMHVLNEWFALNPLVEGANFQVWQLITYQFMHAGFGHIFFNMFMLWMFGMEIENIMGSKKFLYYYLICGVAAGLAQLFIAPLFSVPAFTIGASGAVFGVMIAFALMFPDRLIFLWFLIPIKAKYLIGFLFVLEIFWIGDAGSNVAHLAHLGGAIAGFIFIFSGITERFRKKDDEVKEAKFYDLKDDADEKITQEDIDEILDKISKSGYQNLTEKEKKTLFEASKKMN